jgi:hypothetical protein
VRPVCNDAYVVQCPVVDGELTREPFQGVPVALDFVSGQATIDHGDIDPDVSLAETQLIDDKCLGIGAMERLKLANQGRADVSVTHARASPGGAYQAAHASPSDLER